MKRFFIISFLFVLNFFSSLAVFANDCHKDDSMKCCCSDYRVAFLNMAWWDNFSDPLIKDYIYKALCKNHKLKSRQYKTDEYRQEMKYIFSSELPMISFLPFYARIKTPSRELGDFELAATNSNIITLPVVAKYELDLFLKNHDRTKVAKEEVRIYEFEEKAMAISVAAEVATLYINAIKLDEIIEKKEAITEIRKKIYELTKEREKMGLASTYDVTYSNKLYIESRIMLNDLKKSQELILHKLCVLLDENPDNSTNLLRNNFDNLDYSAKVPEYLTSEVVLYRPDLMKVEAELKKAKIDIRIARKNFLPQIPIYGAIGYNTLSLSSLFDWDSTFALIFVGLTQRLFTGGALTATLRKKKAVYQRLFEEYKQADLVAIQEVNDALSEIKYDQRKEQENTEKLKLEIESYKLLDERYKAGIMSYLQLIQYKENILSLENDVAENKAQRLIDYISLYKATGAVGF